MKSPHSVAMLIISFALCRMVKDFSASNKQDQISRLIRVLEEFAMSHNPHTRKGGLIGLAAVAIGLGR